MATRERTVPVLVADGSSAFDIWECLFTLIITMFTRAVFVCCFLFYSWHGFGNDGGAVHSGRCNQGILLIRSTLMKQFLRIIVVVSVLQSAVWGTTIPVELLNWQMPQQVKIQGTLKITNGITASGTYNIESWHFKGSQIHILDSQKDSLRLVVYQSEASPSDYRYWSKGHDKTFGGWWGESAKDGYGVPAFSALFRLNADINQLKTAKDSDITLSTNDSEGTITVEKADLNYYRNSKTIFHYSDNRLLSVDFWCQTEETTPVLVGRSRTVFSDYSSDTSSPIPMSCSDTEWLPPDNLLFDWHYNSVTPIDDGQTTETVLSGATLGLTSDRWPAKFPSIYWMVVLRILLLVSLVIGLLVVFVLFLIWLWKRRRRRS